MLHRTRHSQRPRRTGHPFFVVVPPKSKAWATRPVAKARKIARRLWTEKPKPLCVVWAIPPFQIQASPLVDQSVLASTGKQSRGNHVGGLKRKGIIPAILRDTARKP